MKLLVVDDQGPVGAIISRIAQQGGWDAVNTTSADNLADLIRSEAIDVLLLDYLISDDPQSPQNGLTVLEDLRKQSIDLPTIIFTGWPDLVDRQRASALGVISVLSKPLSIQELRLSLHEARKRIAG